MFSTFFVRLFVWVPSHANDQFPSRWLLYCWMFTLDIRLGLQEASATWHAPGLVAKAFKKTGNAILLTILEHFKKRQSFSSSLPPSSPRCWSLIFLGALPLLGTGQPFSAYDMQTRIHCKWRGIAWNPKTPQDYVGYPATCCAASATEPFFVIGL